MKFKIDTTTKSITLEETVNLESLVNLLSEMLKDWKDYKLVNNSTSTTGTKIQSGTGYLTGVGNITTY